MQAARAGATPEVLLSLPAVKESSGLLARVGALTVGADEVHFEPRLIDRLAGAKAWTVPVSGLTRLERRDEVVELAVGDDVHHLEGPEAASLEEAVREALAQHPALAATPPELSADERVLFSGDAFGGAPEGPSRPGRFTVTTRRVHFAHAGLDRVEAGAVPVDWPLAELTALRRADDGLDVARGAEAFHVTVTDARELFVRLTDLDDATPLRRGGLRTREVRLLRAGTRVAGLLRLERRAVRFTPLAGTAPVLLPLAAMTRAELSTRTTPMLSVRLGTAEWSFQYDAAAEDFEDLLVLLAHLEVEGEPRPDVHGQCDERAVEALIAEWREQLPGLTARRVFACGPVALVPSERGALRGALLLFDQGLVFLPAGGPKGAEARFVIAADALTLRDLGAGGAEATWARRDGGTLRVVPRGGGDFLRRLVPQLKRVAQAFLADSREARNRRSAFRVRPVEPTTVHVHLGPGAGPDAKASELDTPLVDLSTDGCRVEVPGPVPGVRRLSVVLEDGLQPPLVVDADLVHSLPPSVLSPTWKVGARFVRMEPEAGRRVRDLVMELQRRELEARSAHGGEA